MLRKHRKTSLIAAVVGVLLITLTQSPIAAATVNAQTENSLSITSGNIRVFATVSQSFTATGTSLSTSIPNSVKAFYVNNSGDLTVSQFNMTITLPSNSNISSFRRCGLNVSVTPANVCASGSATNLTNPVSGAATVYSLSLPGSGFYAFLITQNKTGTLQVSTSASLQNVSFGTSNS
jgi:hypothetical protein